jgi:hypothetical protein
MTIDQTNKALTIADETVQATEQFMTAIAKLQALEEERVSSGITLGDYDTQFAESSIKHVDGAALNAVLNTSIPAIWSFMTTNFHDDNLQKVRP